MSTPSSMTTATARPAVFQNLPVEGQARLPIGVSLDRASVADFENATRREWLVTNGIGGYAAGTVGGARSRRYHGFLVGALNPPLGRTVMLAKIEATASYLGRRYELSSNEFQGGIIAPDGFKYIESFSLEGNIPIWRYVFADVVLEQRIWMTHGENSTFVQWSILRASDTVELSVTPLVTYRDYHSQNRGSLPIVTNLLEGGFELQAFDGARPYRLLCDRGSFVPEPDWYWGFRHRVEGFRGLDDSEDLFRPGHFELTLEQGESAGVVTTAERSFGGDSSASLNAEMRRQRELVPAHIEREPEWIRQLALAADQFIVQRGTGDGRTVIAGYPWFGDWGRDTMIALPGLTLATGRTDIARQVLLTFAEHVSDGMLPNRFPDQGENPEYNTVDATLWYFHAIDCYLQSGTDDALLRDLYPVLTDIIDWHRRGTRYSIHVDSNDGLLAAGEPGVQLTWMDAKVGDWVVTPRIGKPVEINALWYNALAVMTRLATRMSDDGAATNYRKQATAVAAKIRERFWNSDLGCLYDVIDGPEGDPDDAGRRRDQSLRPNQLFAVSLPASPLSAAQARAVVDVCARELYTPMGMRSLGAGDSRYLGHYGGSPYERDGAYHQGTVWSWLLGPFVTAHYRVYRDAPLARSYLEGIAGHLQDACLGQISEIFDADAPHAPRGCTAQAWSVAEVLRAWLELSGYTTSVNDGDTPQ